MVKSTQSTVVLNQLTPRSSWVCCTAVMLYCCCHKLFVHQVELLWRRAEGDAREVQSGKLYMLMNAELLDYDVSRRVEESLEKHSHAVPGQFTLTLVTSG